MPPRIRTFSPLWRLVVPTLIGGILEVWALWRARRRHPTRRLRA